MMNKLPSMRRLKRPMMKLPTGCEFRYIFGEYTFSRPTLSELQQAVASYLESQGQSIDNLDALIEDQVCHNNPQMPQYESPENS
jgi:hypothetical protein